MIFHNYIIFQKNGTLSYTAKKTLKTHIGSIYFKK
jgi:hypothetical protein